MIRDQELLKFWQPIYTSFRDGKTALPLNMGLRETQFHALITDLFKDNEKSEGQDTRATDKQMLYQDLVTLRRDEVKQLTHLLRNYTDPENGFYSDLAIQVMAVACMGSDHLWSDLGLSQRPVLGEMIQYYFPTLHQKNSNNMRWKRFFYKQLCEQEGDYLCRAPSCEECSSFQDCFHS